MLPTSPLAAIRWLPLVNQSGSTIPAFACLRVVGTALDSTGQLIYTVDRPNGDATANYMFNGPSTVAAGATGSGTLDFPCQAIWDAGTPTLGEVWGPKSGQWTLTKNGSPKFPVLGLVDSSTGRMLISSPSKPPATIVKPDYDIAAISSTTPGSGSGEVFTFDGTNLNDSATSVTVHNLNTQVAKAGTFYECVFVDGYAFIISPGGATLFEATIYGAALAATDPTGEVTPTTAFWGALPDSSDYPITVSNDFALQGPVGRTCLVARADGGTYCLIQIKPPSDVLFEGTLDTTLLTTDATATVVPTKAIYGGLPSDATITAANDFQTSGSYGQLVLVAEDILGNYYLIPTTSQPLPILFWTTLDGDLAATAASADCNAGVTPIFGTMAAAGFSAANRLNLSGKSGAKCLVAGDANQTDGAPTPNYYLLAVPSGGGCTFTLQEDLSSGSADATVGTPWGGAPDATGDTITVNDPQGLFARALGPDTALYAAQGEAIYDPVAGYIVVACDQETLKYKCSLSGTLTYDATADVGSLSAMNAKPFGQTRSAEISPANPLALAGPNSAIAYIEWNQTGSEWELTGVQNYKQTEVTGVQLSGLAIQTKTRDAVGMFNAAETAFSTVGTIGSTTVTAVVGESFASGTLSYTTKSLTVLAAGTVSAANNLFTTVSLSPVTSLRYYSSTHNFQDKTTAITAIDPSYTATADATEEADWEDWATAVKGDPVTTVNWDGTNTLNQTTTDMYVMEVASPNTATTAGSLSLSTTTATVVTGVSYTSGVLSYVTNTLTVLAAGTASSPTNLFSTGTVTAVVGVEYTGHAFQQQTQTFTAISPGSTGSYAEISGGGATAVSLVNAVTWDGSSLSQSVTEVYVMEAGTAGDPTTIDTSTPCPT